MAKQAAERYKFSGVRLHHCHILTPKKWDDGNSDYNMVVMIPKENKADVQRAIQLVKAEAHATFPDGLPPEFRNPLKDGTAYAKKNDLDVELFKDYVVFKAKRKVDFGKPKVIGPDLQDIIDPSEVYPGTNAHVVVTLQGYTKPQQGVGFYIFMVQVRKGGERLISEANPEDYFEAEVDFGGEDGGEDTLDFQLDI